MVGAVLRQTERAVELQQFGEGLVLYDRNLNFDVAFPGILGKVAVRSAPVLAPDVVGVALQLVLAELGADRDGHALIGPGRLDAVSAQVSLYGGNRVIEGVDRGAGAELGQVVQQGLAVGGRVGAEGVEGKAAIGRAGGALQLTVDADDIEGVVDTVVVGAAPGGVHAVAGVDAAHVVAPALCELAAHAGGRAQAQVEVGIGDRARIVEAIAHVERGERTRACIGTTDGLRLRGRHQRIVAVDEVCRAFAISLGIQHARRIGIGRAVAEPHDAAVEFGWKE